VRKRWRIGDDYIANKRSFLTHHLQIDDIIFVIRNVNASAPEAFKHLGQLVSSSANLPPFQSFYCWNQTRIFTMNVISSAGLPPTEKNSRPESF